MMDRVVIERRNLFIYVVVILVAVVLILSITVLWFVGLNLFYAVNLFYMISMAIILSAWVYYSAGPGKKEMLVIDENGLTINGDIRLGPIPWDCINGAELVRISLEKKLIVYITNISKMEMIFGREIIRKKVGKNRKNGKKAIFFELTLCRWKEIDLETLILERATGRKD